MLLTIGVSVHVARLACPAVVERRGLVPHRALAAIIYYSVPRTHAGRVFGLSRGCNRPWRGQKCGFADAEGPFGKMGKAFLHGFVEFCSKTGAELTLFCRNVRGASIHYSIRRYDFHSVNLFTAGIVTPFTTAAAHAKGGTKGRLVRRSEVAKAEGTKAKEVTATSPACLAASQRRARHASAEWRVVSSRGRKPAGALAGHRLTPAQRPCDLTVAARTSQRRRQG